MMNDDGYDTNDAELLFSRSLDGDLDDDGRRRLDQSVAASPSLRAAADGLASADRLVRRWASESARVDADAFHDAVLARIAEVCDDDALRPVDAIVRRWAEISPRVDRDAFAAGVRKRIRLMGEGRGRRSWAFRMGAPLAAAAAIMLAVTATMWRSATHRPMVSIALGPVASIDAPGEQPAPRVVIRISRRERNAEEAVERRRPISFGAAGSEPVVASDAAIPPL